MEELRNTGNMISAIVHLRQLDIAGQRFLPGQSKGPNLKASLGAYTIFNSPAK